MAHAWARQMRLRNPYGKAVLMALTHYVNDVGSCFCGIPTLAEDTDLSDDTVRKRLKWLEEIGAIARFPRWRDDKGVINGDGRGKRTSDDIRLLLESDPEFIEARAHGEAPEDATDEDVQETVSPRPQQGLTDDASPRPQQGLNTGSPGPALGQPSHCGEGLNSEPEPEPKDSPPNPPPGGLSPPMAFGQEENWPGSETWPLFEKAWKHPITRQSLARQVWAALSETERPMAIKAAHGYNAWRDGQRRPPNVLNANTFLKELDAWPRFCELAPAPPPPPPPPLHFVEPGSDEWRVLRVLAAIEGRPDPEPRWCNGFDRKGLLIPAPLPSFGFSLLAFAVEHEGKIDTRDWKIVAAGTQSCGAWRQRFADLVGRWPEPWQVPTGEVTTKEIMGKSVEWVIKIQGLHVPSDWPSSKSADPERAAG